MFVIVACYKCFTVLPYFFLEPNSCINKRFAALLWKAVGLTVDTVLRCKGAGPISKDHVLQEFDIGADHNTMACYFFF